MRGFIVLIIVLIVLPSAAAAKMVVINSEDWHDVYTGIIYAKLSGLEVHYVAEKTQGLQLAEEVLPKYKDEILLIESEKPIVFGYQSHLERAGFTVEKYTSSDYLETSLYLARRTKANGYIVVDGSLGYDAMSIAPYALLTNSSVIFAESRNIEDIRNFLEQQEKNIILYGRVDREVKELLSPLSSTIINYGGIYENNVRIVSKFMDIKKTKQVYLTNGEIIESGFFNNEFPLLLIGTDRVPGNVLDFIKESDVRTGVVVGYDLFSNSKQIRDQSGIKILLKYGQGRNSQLYALDVFPLPKYDPRIEITRVEYNSLNKQLEVTYQNIGNVYTMVQALSHTIKSNDVVVENIGDENAFFLQENDFKTIIYDVDLTPYLDTEISVDSVVTFGESEVSLTKLFILNEIKVNIVSSEDQSSINIEDVVYNRNTGRFEITLKNTGKKAVYADVEIIDLFIGDEKTTLGGEQQKILPNQKGMFKIKADLQETDFEDNNKVAVEARYGEREDVLLKTVKKQFDFKLKTFDYQLITLIAIVIIIIALVVKIKKRKRGWSLLVS